MSVIIFHSDGEIEESPPETQPEAQPILTPFDEETPQLQEVEDN